MKKFSLGQMQRRVILVALIGLFITTLVGKTLPPRFFAYAAPYVAAQATTCPTPNLTLAKQITLDAGATHYFVPGDFNGDGKKDLVVYTQFASKLYTLLGDGAGNLTVTTNKILNAGEFYFGDGPYQVGSGDFNGDGKLDFIALFAGGSDTNKIQIYLNNGAGSFGNPTTYTLRTFGFSVGDFNKDGKSDFAVAQTCCPEANYIYLSNANGTHTQTAYNWGSSRISAVADFNGDGNLDILTSDNYYPSSQVRLGNGKGQFTNGDYLYYGVQVYYFATTDFNKNGKADVLGYTAQNRIGLDEANSRKLIVLSGDGAGHFTASYPTAPLDAIPFDSIAADFTGDGYPDIATRATDIFTNNGTGGLCSAFSLTTSSVNTNRLVAADFNGDGKADLIRDNQLWVSGNSAANTPPTISLQPTIAAQGSASAPVFGTVADAQTPVSSLQLSATNLPAGVTLTNLRSNNGSVTGDLTVGCAVAVGTYQIPIRVTDGSGLSATANWALTVGANQAPILGAYANTTVSASVVTVTPSRAPGDEGTISSVTVAAPPYVGSISVATNGVVTINNNNVAGSYVATVTAIDNCGLKATTSFTFTVPATPPPTCNVPSFQRGATIAIANAVALIPGDFNKDGFQDVIVVRTVDASGGLALSSTYFGDGRGGFNLVAGKSVFDNVINPGDLVKVGDFNSDGYTDLGVLRFSAFIGTRPQYNSFQTLLNDKTGRITGAGGGTFSGIFYGFDVGDINNDSYTDVVVNTGYNNAVYLNNKNNTFAKLPNEFGFPTKLILVDYNGDGRLDLMNENEGSIYLWAGNGTGGFALGSGILRTGSLQTVTDLDFWGSKQIVTLVNGQLTLGFTSFPQYTSAVLTAADFTGDGKLELLLADGRVPIFGPPNGLACGTADFRAQGLTNPAAAADFNGDGKADILTTTATGFTLWTSGGGGGTTNTPPTITVAPLTVAQGSGAIAGIGTVSDSQTPAGNLIVSATNLPGIVVTNITLDNNGIINGTISVSCSVVPGLYQIPFKVTDGGGLTATTNLALTITPNQAPIAPTYPNVTLSGSSIEIFPSVTGVIPGVYPGTSWSDDTISPPPLTFSVSAFPGGSITIDTTVTVTRPYGIVKITSNNIPGTYLVSLKATDPCGISTSTQFTFTIPPTTVGCATPTFNAPQSVAAGNDPYGLASGDFNGDGKADLAVTNFIAGTVRILLGGATAGATYNVGALPNYAAAKDVNGDGKLDLVVVNRGSDTVTILLGTGTGAFTKKGDYQVGNKSTGVTIGDFNSDGKMDLAVTNDGLGNIAILDGNGDGSFKLPRYYYAGPSPQPGVAGDFDKDNKLDLAFPNYFSGEVTIIFGDGAGNFGRQWVNKTADGIGLEGITVGDLNGDGNLDLVVTNSTKNIVIPILGNGAGGFTQAPGFGTNNQYLASIQIGDFNGDGLIDVAVGDYGSNSVYVYKGRNRAFLTENTFDNVSPTIINVGSHPLSLQKADFNGDGKPDLAVANNGSGTVSVILNGCPK